MNFIGHLAMIGWVPVVLLLFSSMKDRRRAVIVSYLAAWLFLPFASYSLPGIPDYNKFSATTLSVMLAVCIYDPRRLLSTRPQWFDIPMAVFCSSALVTSLVNGLGLYDGLAASLSNLIMWGFPYLVGRMYFSDLKGLEELATGIFIGGLVYVPLILIESRLGPQINLLVYGLPSRTLGESFSILGPLRWKPTVFMNSSLALTMFMAAAALCGGWLWLSGVSKRFFGVPAGYAAALVFCGAVLSKSLGALTLMMGGFAVAVGLRVLRRPVPIICLLLVAPTYMTVRTTGLWTGRDVVEWVNENISVHRGGSLQVRLENEDLLVPKALERRWFGWGRWGRMLVYDDAGSNISIPDGLWVIVIGQMGLVGLVSLWGAFLLPPGRLLMQQPAAFWRQPAAAGAVVLTVVLLIYSVDCLLNAMINPIYTLAAGGLICLPRMRAVRRRARLRQMPAGSAGIAAPRTSAFPTGGTRRMARPRSGIDARRTSM